MDCPSCNSENTRRSRRRGLGEGLLLRLKHEAPYRCRSCGSRFVATDGDYAAGVARRPVSFARYLGLRGATRRLLTDHMMLAMLGLLLLVMLALLSFALALDWVNFWSEPLDP